MSPVVVVVGNLLDIMFVKFSLAHLLHLNISTMAGLLSTGVLVLPNASWLAQGLPSPSPESDPRVVEDLDAYFPYLGALSSRQLCSLGGALVAQERADDGITLLTNIIAQHDKGERPTTEGTDDAWLPDACLNAGIALCAQRHYQV